MADMFNRVVGSSRQVTDAIHRFCCFRDRAQYATCGAAMESSFVTGTHVVGGGRANSPAPPRCLDHHHESHPKVGTKSRLAARRSAADVAGQYPNKDNPLRDPLPAHVPD